MKKRYLVVALLLMFVGIISTKALTVGDCEVLASFKLSSSLDEEKYICKGKEFGNSTDVIYYSGEGNKIYLNNFNAYYFTNWDLYDVVIDIKGKNNISLLHIGDSKFKVTGSGSLKFKQNSFVKKVINGEAVYQYVYDKKTVLDSDKKIYEGTTLEFEENYELLKKENNLPEEYKIENFLLIQAQDYTKMTSVVVTEAWIKKNIETVLETSLNDGFGIIEYVKPKKKETSEKEVNLKKESQLETDNVILISDKKLKAKYKLKEENLKEKEIANKVIDSLESKDLISFYDVSVYNGKKEVSMKNGKYIIKIKLDSDVDEYENYQIIYVNDNNEIAEYIDGYIEGEYIVFETTHLSQYGVIANQVVDSANVNVNTINPVKKNSINVSNIFKISLLLSIVIFTTGLIVFILLKSDLLSKKKTRRKRA